MNDLDAEASRLLAPLRDLHPASTGVDVAAAARHGRRRYRALRATQIGGAAGLTAVVAATTTLAVDARSAQDPVLSDPSPPVGQPAACTVAALPSPLPGARTLATAVDPTGRFVVGRAYLDSNAGGPSTVIVGDEGQTVVAWAAGSSYAVVWDNGTPSLIEGPGTRLQLDAVNSSGVAVGSDIGDDGESVAVVYQDGSVTRLAGGSAAVGIGENGQIAGYLDETAAGVAGTGVAVWATPDAEPTPLGGVPTGWVAQIASVAPDGTVVGWATPPAVQRTPQDVENTPRGTVGYLWRPDGSATPLPTPTLPGRPVVGFSAMVLAGDRVVGVAYVEDPSIEGRLVSVDLSTGTATEYAADAPVGHGWQANARGWFLVQAGDGREAPPAIATPTGRIDLPLLPGLASQVALGINDDATVIVGQGYDPDSSMSSALIWRNCGP